MLGRYMNPERSTAREIASSRLETHVSDWNNQRDPRSLELNPPREESQ